MTLVSAVRWALQNPSTAPSVRAALVSWVSPALVGVVDELTAAAKAAAPTQVTLRGRAGGLVVTATGADPAAVASEETRIRTRYEVPNTSLTARAGLASAVIARPDSAMAPDKANLVSLDISISRDMGSTTIAYFAANQP